MEYEKEMRDKSHERETIATKSKSLCRTKSQEGRGRAIEKIISKYLRGKLSGLVWVGAPFLQVNMVNFNCGIMHNGAPVVPNPNLKWFT